MRTRSFGWLVFCTSWMLAAIVAAPRPAAAQCTMMGGGGGHDHSAMHGRDSRKPSGSQKKLQQSIDRLLSDDEGRAMLADALLNDRAFMKGLLQRVATIPEWNPIPARPLAPGSPGDSLESAAPVAPPAAAELYVCPMHSDVTSSKPGACPKCGMTLVRTTADHTH